MKNLLCAMLTSFFLLTACTTPSVSDFQSEVKPLAADDVMVIWRFPHKASLYELLDTSSAHKASLEAHMAPFFQQVFPRIFSDAKNKKLTIWESGKDIVDITTLNDIPISNLSQKMEVHHGANWQDISPFTYAFHIIQKRNGYTKGFKATELELEIISHDPNGQLAESRLGTVRMADLKELGYSIEVEGKSYDLSSYLAKGIAYGYPISYTTTEMNAGLQSLQQAFQTKQYVLEGKWDAIEWLGSEPNLSNFRFQEKSLGELRKLVGTYVFAPDERSHLTNETEAIPVEIEIKEDYMKAFWPNKHQYFQFLIYPAADNKFFTTGGYEIEFKEMEDKQIALSISDGKGIIIKGIRK